MIHPDFNIFLWILLIFVIIGAIGRIILGAMNAEKSQKYGLGDVITGIIELCLFVWVMLK